MVFTMERRETFSSAHRLHSLEMSDEENKKVYGKCNNPNGHGHNYVWRVILKGEVDSRTGMLYDLGALKKEMAEVLDIVDHKHLDKDVDYFRSVPSTSENVVRFLYESIKSRLSRPELLKECILHETEKNVFTYSE
ncbi:hypothetical protein PMAYCL1PPCAC_22017 [Pristionchus mayeri]|uniref:6-pyruvoyltetrahydropterin synthase n=1 Tax=Pristionchus mayeri TaxID=1317129 RepID=A0AAN5I4D7_9BILA|nr:hypothetical protein PMAYCL1PPCAC_22017 [Pristionchus mayeri]